MKSYSTRGKRKPTEADANVKGYLFARKPDRIGYEGVLWHQVKWPEYDRWSPAEFYATPGDKKGMAAESLALLNRAQDLLLAARTKHEAARAADRETVSHD